MPLIFCLIIALKINYKVWYDFGSLSNSLALSLSQLTFYTIMPKNFFHGSLISAICSSLNSVSWDVIFCPQEYSLLPFHQANSSSLIHLLKCKFKEAFATLKVATCSLISEIHITALMLFYCYQINCLVFHKVIGFVKIWSVAILPETGTCGYSLVVVEWIDA